MADIDKLRLLSGKPIIINENIVLYQPTVREVSNLGEDDFYGAFWSLCSSPWDMPATFDDMGIDFMQVSDWEFFRNMVKSLDGEYLKLIFKDMDLKEFVEMLQTTPDGEQRIVLWRESDGFIFDETMYEQMIKYLREIIGFTHKGRKAKDKATKKILIMEDRKERERNKNKDSGSMLFNAIISLVNTEEFSYNYETVYDLTIYQLMKSLVQIQGKKSAMALLQGSMSGMMDTSSVPQQDFNWTYSDEKYKPKAKKLVNQKIK